MCISVVLMATVLAQHSALSPYMLSRASVRGLSRTDCPRILTPHEAAPRRLRPGSRVFWNIGCSQKNEALQTASRESAVGPPTRGFQQPKMEQLEHQNEKRPLDQIHQLL